MGESLEAVALKPAGDKPIEQSDAAAIQAAEARATGRSEVVPGGVGAQAQRAASINADQTDDNKTTLGDVLKVSPSKIICVPMMSVGTVVPRDILDQCNLTFC